MDARLARELVDLALREFHVREVDLPHDVNERSATHRLAVHLESALRRRAQDIRAAGDDPDTLVVDCEYNRDGLDPKRLDSLEAAPRNVPEAVDDTAPVATRDRTVFPDIIVHKRGTGGPNLIVIEVKREEAAEEAVEFDRNKLRRYKDELSYEHAFLVTLTRDRTPRVEAL